MGFNMPVDLGRLQSRLHLDEIRAVLIDLVAAMAGTAAERWDALIDIVLVPKWGDEHEWAVTATGSPEDIAAIRGAVNIFAAEHAVA